MARLPVLARTTPRAAPPIAPNTLFPDDSVPLNPATVAALAGLVYDKDGRLLIFAIMAPQVPGAAMLPAAAGAINAAAAALADCGCR